VPATDLDPDSRRVGCVAVPGHPRFYGQSTAYVFLAEACVVLAPVRHEVIRIMLPD